MNLPSLVRRALLLMFVGALWAAQAAPWSTDRAAFWYGETTWPVGCNFTPSTAINQLEMWQADTFDPTTISRELRWAHGLGFNAVRVFLHNLAFEQDPEGFLKRVDQFLRLADKNQIKVMFVLFDSCWNPFPKVGRQPDPVPGIHNSGWVQCPGLEVLGDATRHDDLAPYVKTVTRRFKNDSRVLAWDLFNEPDNMNRPSYVAAEPADKPDLALALLKKAFAWARECEPSQPLTAGVWVGPWGDPEKLSAVEKVSLTESDVVSFHNYGWPDDIRVCVQNLKRYKRPILCTEYMARPAGSSFDPILRYLKQEKVGAMNWGFVSGKTQTVYPWDSWEKPYASEPEVWFHDIIRSDGTAFNAVEVDYIKRVTKRRL